MQVNPPTQAEIAHINGFALHAADEVLSADELRQRACSELLRQAAIAKGLLPASDTLPTNGVLSEDASSAIEALLEQSLAIPEPSEEACRRHHAAHATLYSTGERVQVRHILFAVTQGVDVVALRNVVEVLAREPSIQQAFEAVSGAVAMSLRQKTYVTALRQYLQLLTGEAVIRGIDLEASETPLMQ